MKHNFTVLPEITPLSDKDCFYIADRYNTEFTSPLQRYAEFELNFTAYASGVKRIIGDSIEVIGDYDLILLANENLEHVWEPDQYKSSNARVLTVQFSSDLFIPNLLKKSQFGSIRRMLDKAKEGLSFPMSAVLKVYKSLDMLSSEKNGFYSVMKFLSILYELSQFYHEARTLSSSSFARVRAHSDSRRIQKVHEFVECHYREDLRLDQLADLSGMTPVSFSRFYKQRTGKSVSDYIIDMRLGHAIRLLIDSEMPIYEICYESGFNNVSNFNRIFKKKKDYSPKEFRDNYRRKRLFV